VERGELTAGLVIPTELQQRLALATPPEVPGGSYDGVDANKRPAI